MGRLLQNLDNFFSGKWETNHSEVIISHFQACISTLGIPIASAKIKDPTFWGLDVDSDEMVICLLMDKVHDIIQKIEDAM